MFAGRSSSATVERGELWTDGLLNVTPSAVLSVSILTNNIVVSFFAFCFGNHFRTRHVLSSSGMNGLSLGAIFAFTGQHGLAGTAVRLRGRTRLRGAVVHLHRRRRRSSLLGEALVRPER